MTDLSLKSVVVAAVVVGGLSPQVASARAPSIDAANGRCGTTQILEARVQLQQAADRAASGDPALCNPNPRPNYDVEEIYDDDTYKFRIHYTTDPDDDRYVTLADVQRTADVMRETMDAEAALGYPMPPDDSIDAEVYCDEALGAEGGNGYYDIYFVNEDNIYGYARPMSLVPDSSTNTATSHLALSTWILDVNGGLEVTVAHEFFHAIQFTYDVYENGFWMENSAVWMEEQVYDDVNDYLYYVPEAFDNPDVPLDANTSIQYAYGLWPMYMTQELGQGLIKDIWQVCAATDGENAFAAQKQVIDGVYDGGWAQLVLDFRGAMYNKAEFDEGDLYNRTVKATEAVTTYPREKTYNIDHTAGAYVIFSAPVSSTSDTLQLCFTGTSAETRAKIYLRDYDDNRTEIALSPNNNAGSVTVPGLGTDVRQVALVVTYGVTNDRGDSYTYYAEMSDTPCEPGEPGEPSTPNPTPGSGGIDDGNTTTVCGGCVVIEESERSGAAGAALNLLWLGMGVFLVRRRTR